MTTTCYNSPYSYANLGYDNWPSQDITKPLLPVYAALVTSAYTPNVNTDGVWANVSAHECSGSGYTTPGMQVSLNNTIGTNLLDDEDLDCPYWTIPQAAELLKDNPPLTPRYCVYYIFGTVKAQVKPLISYQDLGAGWSISPIEAGDQAFVVLEDGALLLTEDELARIGGKR